MQEAPHNNREMVDKRQALFERDVERFTVEFISSRLQEIISKTRIQGALIARGNELKIADKNLLSGEDLENGINIRLRALTVEQRVEFGRKINTVYLDLGMGAVTRVDEGITFDPAIVLEATELIIENLG